MAADLELLEGFPPVAEYRRLREVSGLSPKTQEAAERGLGNTLYGVRLQQGAQVVGMGRIIGDGGCFFTIVDIAVDPALQRRGLGRKIMTALDRWLVANVPASAYVSLAADGDARYLYEKFGFRDSAPATINMAYVAPRAESE